MRRLSKGSIIVTGNVFAIGNILIRDIKLENILLDEKNHVKIIDFGFSTCIPNDKKIKIFCGTPSYMAPEIVSKIEFAGPPADIWALGVLLYAILCGSFPFRGANDQELYGKIKKGIYSVPDHLSAMSKSLIKRMLCVEAEKRPTSKEILKDFWLNQEKSFDEINALPKRASRDSSLNERKINVEAYNEYYCSGPKNVKIENMNKVNNTINIFNNITLKNKRKSVESFDQELINSIINIGYSINEIKQQLKNQNSHISLLYKKLLENKKINANDPSISKTSNISEIKFQDTK